MRQNTIAIIVTVLLLALIGVLMADCIGGRDRHLECTLSRHQYVAPWTETQWHTDSEGTVTFTTVDHPEEFHLIFVDMEQQNAFDVEVPQDQYQRMKDGQYATVKVRQGRWTKARWMPTIIEQ